MIARWKRWYTIFVFLGSCIGGDVGAPHMARLSMATTTGSSVPAISGVTRPMNVWWKRTGRPSKSSGTVWSIRLRTPSVLWRAHRRGARFELGIDVWERRAVDAGIRQELRVEHVQQAGLAVLIELDQAALEELHGEALEQEGERDGAAEHGQAAAMGEEVPDGVVDNREPRAVADVAQGIDDLRGRGGQGWRSRHGRHCRRRRLWCRHTRDLNRGCSASAASGGD